MGNKPWFNLSHDHIRTLLTLCLSQLDTLRISLMLNLFSAHVFEKNNKKKNRIVQGCKVLKFSTGVKKKYVNDVCAEIPNICLPFLNSPRI